MYALKLFPVVCCYEWKDGNGLKKKNHQNVIVVSARW